MSEVAHYYPIDVRQRTQVTREQFEARQQAARRRWQATMTQAEVPVIIVPWGSSSVAHGVVATFEEIRQWLSENEVKAIVRRAGPMGTHYLEPQVDIILPGMPRISYAHITADKVGDLLHSVLELNDLRPDLAVCIYGTEEWDGAELGVRGIPVAKELDFWKLQQRMVGRNLGYIDPESIDDYIARGGYEALKRVLSGISPDDVIQMISDSGLRGRGGAGFPTGTKWSGGRKARKTPKYVICNSHEGEPNVFKDRALHEGDPHQIVEGLIIQAYAVGTPWAYMYVGDEYPLAIHRTKIAVQQAYAAGLLGDNIMGSGFSCHMDVQMGGGAYISGEASALMFGIEGKRAMPRTKPPRSVEAGLFNLPTVVNNTETISCVPHIIVNGPQWFSAIGTEKSKGTKLFTLMGSINTIGVYELPLGRTMRELVEVCGGGCMDGHPFKAIQTGGPSGGCMPEQYLDVIMDFDSLDQYGGTMGSGGYVVYDDRTCIVDMSRYFGRFNRYQSCGKCVPCRVGTKNLLHMVDRIALGGGKPEDIPIMTKWSDHVVEMSLCGLGQTAPLPLLGGLRYFLEEFEEHINQKHCRTGTCPIHAITVEERFLPARIGERYRQQLNAIPYGNQYTKGNGNGAGTAPASTRGAAVRR
ncbi:MAG TPA: NADH-ubiquinone oxidoreductase-F iron-sulfur binding region domain-containing protein [Chloroflexia bacterium]|jgi:NADH:ubiquinone oxidoreductase subunit F (NADH-binding)